MDEPAGTRDEGGAEVGDPERTAADAQLQAAVGRGALSLGEYEDLARSVWAARTRAELAAVTRAAAPAVRRTAPEPAATTTPAQRTVAVLSESQFSGSVVAGQPVHATAVLGAAVLDLRRTDLPDRVDVTVTTVLGETKVYVPRGVQVHLRGTAVLGSRTTDTAPAEAGAPVVTVRATTVLGTVSVSHGDGEPGHDSGAGVDLVKGRDAVEHRPQRSGGWPLKRIVGVVAVAAAAYGAVQVVGADHHTVFGSGTVTQTGDGTVDIGVLFGSERVVVPDDAVVSTEGGMIFGSVDCDVACAPGRTGGPAITVKGAGAFGSVEVLTVTEAAADRNDD